MTRARARRASGSRSVPSGPAGHPWGVEPLEDRRLFACTVTAIGGSLWITGDDKPNTIAVSVDSTGLTAVCDGSTKRFTFAANQGGSGGGTGKVSLQDIHISSRGGSDVVSLRASADYFLKIRCAIDGGSGDDSLSADCTFAAPSPTGIKGECVITGGSGDDTISATMRATGKHIAKASLFVDGGDGDDAITTRVSADDSAGPPSSSSVTWTVSCTVLGGRGDDSIDDAASFDAVAAVPVVGSSVVDGGSGNDVEVCSFSWGVSNAGAHATGGGGGGAGRFAHKFSHVVRGSSGDDTISVSSVAVDGDKPAPADAPASTYVGTCDAGAGDDSVSVDVQLPPVDETAPLSLNFTKITYRASGGAGDDAVSAVVSPRDAASGQATGRRIVTQCVVDGGSGFDSAVVSGKSVTVSSTVEEVFDLDADSDDGWIA